jgi:hypothetical protein
MRIYTWIIILGIVVYLTPFLGIGEEARAYILFVCGFVLVVLGIALRYRTKKQERVADDITYVETIPSHSDHSL